MLAVLAASPARAQVAGDLAPGDAPERRVEQYLEEHGLLEALASQLAERLEASSGQDRIAIAERLAGVYVELLTRAQTADDRARWERAGRALLASVPEADSIDLRLDLHRAAYARAEEIAERWRIGLATPAERSEALTTFESLERDLAAIGKEADRRVVRLQREEERSADAGGDLLTQSLATGRRQRSLAMYLAGWCNTYIADLEGVSGRAEEALRQFGWLLGAEPGKPATLRRLPRNFLRYEHIARSALGVAVCSALLGRSQEAIAWLDAVERADELPATLREQTPVWRIVILADLGLWRELESGVEERRLGAGGQTRPLASGEARLLATLALRAESDDEVIARMRDVAVADLVRRGEFASVVELAREHGAAAFGATGFVALSVRGLLAYDQATGGEGDTGELYERAARTLADAMRAPDADSFSGAAGEVAMTLGLARYAIARDASSGAAPRYLSAADAFERAASLLGEHERADEALWMAVRSLDEASDAGAQVDGERRDALVEAYLERFPTSPRAGALLLTEAVGDEASPEETIARLEAIPPGSDAYDAARRHIARLLYDQFTGAPEDRRDWAALRYADAAEPLLADDLRAALAGDEESAAAAAARARRILAALVSATPTDAQRAQRALDSLRRLIEAGVVEEAPIAQELRYRAAQIAIARDDLAGAERAMADLRAAGSEEGERLASALARSIYRRALLEWRAAQRSGVGLQETAQRVATIGDRLLESGDLPEGDANARLAIEAGVGEAWFDLWRAGEGVAARAEALRRHESLVDAGVTDPEVLRRLAALAEDAGRIELAIEAWRTLGAGLPRTEAPWFEARWELVRLVASVDADRARSLLDQHAILYPDYGPAPWGRRLHDLHLQLEAAAP
jgi:hypothetical protein